MASPRRTCLGCRAVDEQRSLTRLVLRDHEIVDGTQPRLPGRGAYLHPDPDCFAMAERRRAISRALGNDGLISPELRARLGESD